MSQNPSSNPTLAAFLNAIVGFGCVDDESKQEQSRDTEVPKPKGASGCSYYDLCSARDCVPFVLSASRERVSVQLSVRLCEWRCVGMCFGYDHPDWRGPLQPPYYYWMYYLAMNLRSLNAYRATRNMTTFSFRLGD